MRGINIVIGCGHGDVANIGATDTAINVKLKNQTVPGIHKNIITDGNSSFGISIRFADNANLPGNEITICNKKVNFQYSTNIGVQ